MKDSPSPDRRPITLMATSSLTIMAGAIVSPALPALQRAFASEDQVELLARLVLTTVAHGVALFAPLVGLLVDRLGRRPVLGAGLLLYGAAGSSALWLDSMGAILAGRALLGAGVAAVMTASTTLITDYYQGSARERLLGLQAAAMAGGGVVFLIGGGLLADVSWRAPFASYLVAWLLLPAAWRGLDEPELGSRPGAPLDQPATPAADPTPLGQIALLVMCHASLDIRPRVVWTLFDRLRGDGNRLLKVSLRFFRIPHRLIGLSAPPVEASVLGIEFNRLGEFCYRFVGMLQVNEGDFTSFQKGGRSLEEPHIVLGV